MKILFCPTHYIYDEYQGGSEPYAAFNIADRIAKIYPESIIVTGSKRIASEKNYEIIEIRKRKKVIDLSALNAIVFNVLYTFALWKLIVLEKRKFDIIHHVRPFALGKTFNLFILLGLNGRIPFVIGSFCSPYVSDYRPVSVFEKCFNFILNKLSIATLKKASMVFVYDDYTMNLLSGIIPSNKILIIPPGKEKNTFNLSKNIETSDECELITVGGLTKRKGVDRLLWGMKKVIQRFPNARLRIIGDGVERERLMQLAQDLNIEKNVIFQGFVNNSDVHFFYEKATLYVGLQREESFGQVYIEAMASGLPIVTSRTIGSEGIIMNEETGYIVDDDDEFAERVVDILNDKNKRLSMSTIARSVFEKQYDWDDIVIPKYLDVYKLLVKKDELYKAKKQ